jgi:Bacterial Ig-like domain (group 3)
VALISRRLSVVALAAATAVLGSLAGPLGTAAAADPITTDPAPTLTAPADDPAGSTPLKDVVLTWTAVQHATSYQVQISPNGDWTNNTVSLPNNGSSVTTVYDVPLSLPHAAYYWHVRGVDAAGHTAWSSTRTFLRSWYAPFTVLTQPTSSDPTLAWQPVPEASLYRVRFSTDPTFASGATTFACWTSQTTFTPYTVDQTPENLSGSCFNASDLTDSTTYYWEVTAWDDSSAPTIASDTAPASAWECGTAQPECDAFVPNIGQFTFQAPTAGSISSSQVTGLATTWHAAAGTANACGGATACPTTPTFSWNPVAGANDYRVIVWRDVTRTNIYRVYKTSSTHITPRDAFFDDQAGAGYTWAVEPGTCQASPTQNFCAGTTAAAPTSPQCPSTTTASSPTINSNGLSPTTMNAGATQTVTLTGTGFVSGACVAASNGAGVISNIQVVSATSITFQYAAPASAQQVTFTVVNADGGTSNASPALSVTGQFQNEQFLPPTFGQQFAKTSSPVTLSAPPNSSLSGAGPLTFSWTSFLASGAQGAYDARNYRLEVATDPDFDNVVWNVADIDLTQFTNPSQTLPDGIYYWRIQPIDESGNGLTWSAASQFTRDATPPVFSLTDSSGGAVTSHLHVKASESDLVGTVSQSTLHVVALVGGPTTVSGSWAQTSATSWTFTPSSRLVVGQSYGLRVVGGLTDSAGNGAVASSRTVRVTTLADDKSLAWAFSTGWSRHAASNAIGGTYVSASSGHSTGVSVVGSKVFVYGCKSPSFGKLVVQLDGVTKATVSELQGFTQCGVLLWSGSVSTSVVHRVRLVTSGTASMDAVKVS